MNVKCQHVAITSSWCVCVCAKEKNTHSHRERKNTSSFSQWHAILNTFWYAHMTGTVIDVYKWTLPQPTAQTHAVEINVNENKNNSRVRRTIIAGNVNLCYYYTHSYWNSSMPWHMVMKFKKIKIKRKTWIFLSGVATTWTVCHTFITKSGDGASQLKSHSTINSKILSLICFIQLLQRNRVRFKMDIFFSIHILRTSRKKTLLKCVT